VCSSDLIHLMIRASYHNTRDIRENLETVGVVRTETRKALEHQRVLLSSLNQQIKNLESTIAHDPVMQRPSFPIPREQMPEATMRKDGLLGNLDEFLERGIEQIVANDDDVYRAPVHRHELMASAAPKVQPRYVSDDEELRNQSGAVRNRREGVISMNKLLGQNKRPTVEPTEKTEKIVKLSSIFAHRRAISASNGGVNSGNAGARKFSVG